MSISFDQIPSNLRIPATLAEFDASRAAQAGSLKPYQALLIGQKTSAGSAADGSIHRVTKVEDVVALAGKGSVLHWMAIFWFWVNKSTAVWIGVLADDGAGVAAAGNIAVTGPATDDGTIPLYLGGELVNVAVADDDTAAEIATAIEAAIDARPDLPVIATATDGDVAIVFRHKGLLGNSYNMRDSYRFGEKLPAGVTLTYTQLTGGTTAPSLATLITNMGDAWFDIIAHPYTDATSLTALETEFARRFGPMPSIDALGITSAAGTFSALSTLGNTRNSPHNSIMSQPGVNPLTPPFAHAAEVAGQVALYGAQDPARPFQTLPLPRSLPPAQIDLFTDEERNLLLYEGIGTTKVGGGEVMQIERVITTYQTNAAGGEDEAFLDATTLLTLSQLRYTWRQQILARYPRHKLAGDGTRFGAGQKVMTPKLLRAEALMWFEAMEELGLVEDIAQFEADLIAERNLANVTRMDSLLAPNIVNPLMQVATKFAFLR